METRLIQKVLKYQNYDALSKLIGEIIWSVFILFLLLLVLWTLWKMSVFRVL